MLLIEFKAEKFQGMGSRSREGGGLDSASYLLIGPIDTIYVALNEYDEIMMG